MMSLSVLPPQEGQSPLVLACISGHDETVKLLLERNATVDLQTNVRCEITFH